ncbi:MAG: glycosyltransferase family 1 protein, partial [Prevotella sp.]|nr:glycosyltransferase family 1 protein [Prevotella sp.]
MLKILINAYACSPNMGSEPGMGWNWVLAIARHCEVYVITEGEFQKQIEAALETSELKGKVHFFYNPVPEKIRRMCWNQGDWRFYWYYWKWQRKTANIARDICRQHHIDIIHQLNMIGFREPGCLFDVA